MNDALFNFEDLAEFENPFEGLTGTMGGGWRLVEKTT
jgi:hypothetical protein